MKVFVIIFIVIAALLAIASLALVIYEAVQERKAPQGQASPSARNGKSKH